ncbi:unnamed protein product, partial [Effrenium voratum]
AGLNLIALQNQKDQLRKRKREEKAVERKATFKKERVAATQVGQGALTFLEERSVGLQRRKSYQAAWSLFKKWCLSEGLEWSETEGFHSGLISRVGDMKKTSRALRGLQKLDPALGRVPMPFAVLCLLAERLVELDHVRAASWILLMWATCSRPGEVLKLEWKHLVPPCPAAGTKHWIVILSPSELRTGPGTPSKVGVYDEAVKVDQPYLGWFPGMLDRLRSRCSGDKLIPIDQTQAARAISSVMVDLELPAVGIYSMYQARHGRRWRSLSSLRRYENGGRLAEVFARLPDGLKNQAILAENRIKETFERGIRSTSNTAHSSILRRDECKGSWYN